MKKVILPLAILCLNISMISQTQRTIVYEEFTGENCGPCAATNPAVTTLVHTTGNFPNKVLLIRYQSPIPTAPGAGSLYADNPTEPNTRISYYSVPFAPYARFDGIVLPYPNSPTDDGHASLLSQQYINDSAIVNSPFSLNLGYVINATQDSVTVTATITAAQAYSALSSGSLKLQVAMEEAAIHFATAPGSNGEKDFYDIMRKMMPSTNGTVLNDTWVTAATQTITIKEAIPTYIHDKSQLAFVGFIQDNGSKRVHQAAYAAPLPLVSLDAGINNFTVPTNCSNTVSNLTVNMQNHGVQTITTCTVNYQLDNNPVQTIPYSGSLGTASWVSMVIPTFTASVGQHVFRCYTTNPNGSVDGQPSNDRSATNFAIYALAATPVVEGFETTGSLPNALWDISHTSAGGADFQVTSSAASTGSKSIMVNNFSNVAGNNSIFQTASYYDMTTIASPALSFDAAYQQKVSSNADKLQIFTSIDCGNTWISRRVITGAALASLAGGIGTSPYVPTPSQFTTYTVNINGISTNQNVLFRWEFIADPAGPGNNLYLDNINIVDASSGIKSIGINAELNVYPNPNNGSFVIEFVNSNPVATSVITVTNILGEVVYSENNIGKMTQEINLLNAAKGVYFVKIQASDKTYIRKIIINN